MANANYEFSLFSDFLLLLLLDSPILLVGAIPLVALIRRAKNRIAIYITNIILYGLFMLAGKFADTDLFIRIGWPFFLCAQLMCLLWAIAADKNLMLIESKVMRLVRLL